MFVAFKSLKGWYQVKFLSYLSNIEMLLLLFHWGCAKGFLQYNCSVWRLYILLRRYSLLLVVLILVGFRLGFLHPHSFLRFLISIFSALALKIMCLIWGIMSIHHANILESYLWYLLWHRKNLLLKRILLIIFNLELIRLCLMLLIALLVKINLFLLFNLFFLVEIIFRSDILTQLIVLHLFLDKPLSVLWIWVIVILFFINLRQMLSFTKEGTRSSSFSRLNRSSLMLQIFFLFNAI